MAMADYYCCDLCGDKAFYDADLNYDDEGNLGYVGDMEVICTDCAKTHEVIIREKSTTPTGENDAN